MNDQSETLASEIVSMKNVLPTVADSERDAFIERLAELENMLASMAQETDLSLTGES